LPFKHPQKKSLNFGSTFDTFNKNLKMTHLFIAFSLVIATFSKSDLFKALENGTQKELVALEDKLSNQKPSNDQQAYLGTLKMKSSEFEKTPADKLKKFKAGKILLEKSIETEPSNPEFRFLRLMIQENAPKILKYNDKVKTDAYFIKTNLDKLPKDVKSVVTEYSKSSSNLQL